MADPAGGHTAALETEDPAGVRRGCSASIDEADCREAALHVQSDRPVGQVVMDVMPMAQREHDDESVVETVLSRQASPLPPAAASTVL